MFIQGQEYDRCYPFVWYVWAFAFAIWYRTLRFVIFFEFGWFVVLLVFQFYIYDQMAPIISTYLCIPYIRMFALKCLDIDYSRKPNRTHDIWEKVLFVNGKYNFDFDCGIT